MKTKSMLPLAIGATAILFILMLNPVSMMRTSQAVQNITAQQVAVIEGIPMLQAQQQKIARGWMWFDSQGDGNISSQDCGDDISLIFIQHCFNPDDVSNENEPNDSDTWTGQDHHTSFIIKRVDMAKRVIQMVNKLAGSTSDKIGIQYGAQKIIVTAQGAAAKPVWDHLMKYVPSWKKALDLVLMDLQREMGLPHEIPFDYIR